MGRKYAAWNKLTHNINGTFLLIKYDRTMNLDESLETSEDFTEYDILVSVS